MTPESFNWQKFEHAVIVKTSVKNLFSMVATASGLEKWFLGNVEFTDEEENLESEKIAGVGNIYRWKWLTKNFESSGRVVDIKDGEYVEYTFGDPFKVRFIVSQSGDRSKLQLIQSVNTNGANSPFFYINCCVCWVFFLTNLKSVAEYGVDLRETEIPDETLVNL